MKNWICVVAVVLALGRVALAAMDANTAANIRDIQLLKPQLASAKSFSNLSTSVGTARATKLGDTVTFKGYSGVTASVIGKVFRLSTPSLQSKALQSQYSSHRAAQWSTLGTAAFTAAAAYDPAGAAASVTATTIGAVPTSRTVNGYDLSANRSLTAANVGALAAGGTAVNSSALGGTAAATVVSGAAAGATAVQPVGGVVPVSLGGTGTTTGSITGTGALTFQAGGTNQGVALKPSSQLGTINVGSNTVTGTGSVAVGAVNTVSGPYSSVFGDNNTISGSYNNQDVAVGGNNLLVGDGGGNTVIGQSNALGVNSTSTVMLGAGNSDNGASNVLIGTSLATSANTVYSNLFGTLLNAGAATTTYGVTILGLGDVNNSSPLINNKDGWTMLGTSSTVPTMSITLSDQTGTPVTGTGRVLIATATDDGTSKLQVNGATKATQFNSTVATGTAPPCRGVYYTRRQPRYWWQRRNSYQTGDRPRDQRGEL